MEVPEILLEGHHEKIRRWRKKQSLARTLARRPDLLKQRDWSPEESQLLVEIQSETDMSATEKSHECIGDD
jgi:tRNA (guanine37-N1)-methyltransferase